MSPNVIVSYGPEPGHRTLFRQILSQSPAAAELAFLPEIPESGRREVLSAADVLVTWNISKELQPEEFSLLESVKLIQAVTAGADHLPFPMLPRGAVIASNLGAFAEPMAEHTAAMMLALAKRLVVNHLKLRDGEFAQTTRTRVVKGLTCGVLGLGGIGKAVANVMRALGLKIRAINTTGRTDEPVEFIGTLDDLDEILAHSDVLVVAMPLTRATRGLIGGRELSRMKRDAILINVARGAIIDEQALFGHLKGNPDFCAAIDTWWIEPVSHGTFRVGYPFFDLPNFLGSPHNSAVVPGIMGVATRHAAENVLRFLSGQPVKGVVNREDYLEPA